MASLFDGLVASLEKVTLVDKTVREKLQKCMSPDFGLLEALHANRTISDAEVAEIKKQEKVEGRNTKLLEIILKRGQIQRLATALLDTEQTHLVAFLAGSGVYNKDFEYNWPLSAGQLYMLDALDSQSEKLAPGLMSQQFLSKLVEREAIVAGEKKFIEDRENDRQKTRAMLDILRRTSQKRYYETISSLRIVGQGYIASILKKGVSEIIGKALETDLTDLPSALYHLMLAKAYIKMLVSSPERHPEKDIFRGLCNVSQNWHTMVMSTTFREMYEYHISGYFNRKLRRATVISNNRYYLSWRITPKKFIDFMRHAGCITDDDTRFIKCQTYDHDKIDETLCVVRDLSIEKYAVYIDCLRRTEQHLYADISELGGVTVKAKSIHDDCDGLDGMEKTVIERINQIRNKKLKWSKELENEIDHLRRYDIEILDAIHDRGIIIWFWVHSEEGHEQIHTWRDADHMEPYLTKLFNIIGKWGEPLNELKSDWVIINGFQFNREVVNLPMTLYMATELDVNTEKGPVQGVAALQDNFYILHSKTILIYKADAPFAYASEINSADFDSLTDIAACAKSSRLYVVDAGNACVWKVSLENDQVEKWMSNVGTPFTCSVSGSSGEVLIVRQGRTAFLEVYGADGSSTRKLQLPDDVQNPLHAVETRSGNYDVLDECGLVEMTKEGEVTRRDKSFRHERNKALKKSRHLAIDIGERLYVAEGNRILQFDAQLVYEQVILENARIVNPTRLYFLEKKKLLMVVHSDGQSVFVYKARPRD